MCYEKVYRSFAYRGSGYVYDGGNDLIPISTIYISAHCTYKSSTWFTSNLINKTTSAIAAASTSSMDISKLNVPLMYFKQKETRNGLIADDSSTSAFLPMLQFRMLL